MLQFREVAEVCRQVEQIGSTNEKIRLLADLLRRATDAEAKALIELLAPRHARGSPLNRLGLGGRALYDLARELVSEDSFFCREPRQDALYDVLVREGDLADAVYALLRERRGDYSAKSVSLLDVYRCLEKASSLPRRSDRLRVLFSMMEQLSPTEVWCLFRLLQQELRIGASQGLLLRSIGEAVGVPSDVLERDYALVGDLAELTGRYLRGERGQLRLELFRPVPFMLASPLPSLRVLPEEDTEGWYVEDKYDGIRAQLHVDAERVAIYSRSLAEITGQFPEICRAARRLRVKAVLDGELVAFRDGRVLPFHELQRRLGRVRSITATAREVPCTLFVFDVLLAEEVELLSAPLRERRSWLNRLVREDVEALRLAPAEFLSRRSEIETAFDAALARGNEGIVLKRPESPYAPGTRGQWWFKYKVPFATLDCVVVAAEYGHGKRAGLLSDYLFAVRDGDRLVTVAKAYSGLTDEEIEALTEHFKKTTIRREGHVHRVVPTVVMELGFDSIQRSNRHSSGFALRFPRILRLRPDKTPDQIDTLDRVRELYELQRQGKRHLGQGRREGPSEIPGHAGNESN